MIRVSIIEDHPDFRKGLAYLLDASEGFVCMDTFFSAENALENLSGDEDLILLDINLPQISGIEAIPKIKLLLPEVKIIMLTILDDDHTIMEAILAGADGYLLKKSSPTQILNSIKECNDGGSPMTSSIAKKVLTFFKKFVPAHNETFFLTKREKEILHFLVEGKENTCIAEDLFISVQTVRNHIRHIYEKLQVHSKTQAVVKAIREGLV